MPKAGIQFSKKDEWYTPKEVVDFFGPFDYDPCTTTEQAKHLGIKNFDDINSDGLKADWGYYERIWVNPPFTKKFDFLKRAIDSKKRVFFLMLIETMTTKKFHDIIGDHGYTVWVPNGRINFEDSSIISSSVAFGSVILELNKKRRTVKHWSLYAKDS